MALKAIRESLNSVADPQMAVTLKRFFKSGKGQYGEGDNFVGVTNPVSRKIAKQNTYITMEELGQLIKSKIHEERLIALVILSLKYDKKLKDKKQRDINQTLCYNFYLNNIDYVNNWDLVDLSCINILGTYLLDAKRKEERKIWKELIDSDKLFRKRIAIISTFAFIRKGEFEPTITLANQLLEDQHDLIHKAVGWMLREVGKREISILQQFLQTKYDRIARTTLRYAIQKFPQPKRLSYLHKTF